MTAPKHLTDVLDKAGKRWVVRHGGKHPRLLFEHAGRMRKVVFAATPSDRRGWLNERGTLRRMLGARA